MFNITLKTLEGETLDFGARNMRQLFFFGGNVVCVASVRFWGFYWRTVPSYLFFFLSNSLDIRANPTNDLLITFRIKHVNCIIFQIRVKSVFANFKHNNGLNMLHKRSRSPRHIFRSSGLFLDYPDTFSRLSGHF